MRENRPLMLSGQTAGWTPQTLLGILYLHKRLFLFAFSVVFVPVVLAVLFLPEKYASETKILVQRQRFDPVITSTAAHDGSGADLSQLEKLDEQDIDSEMDLLQSEEVLRRVVIECNLWNDVPVWRKILPIPLASEDKRIAKAVVQMQKDLNVEPPNKSHMVTVTYRSSDPQTAAHVLNVLAKVYLEKHLEVRRPAGTSEFFSQEVERNRKALEAAEAAKVAFTQKEGVVAADTENNTLLLKTADFDASLQSTNAQIASTLQRISNLKMQLKAAKPRVTTTVKTSSALLESLKSTLYSLELKRSELLTKYQADYRPVKDIEKQIADTQAAIANVERAPTSEQTTDQDPVYMWITSEIAHANSELSALRANAAATQRTVADYHSRALRLERLGKEQQELTRAASAAEEVYLVSLRKQNEARVSEALDRSHIMNVAIAQQPTVPALPIMPWTTKLAIGFILALLVATGTTFVADYFDPSFRTPAEVEAVLDIPVLATIPQQQMLRGDV